MADRPTSMASARLELLEMEDYEGVCEQLQLLEDMQFTAPLNVSLLHQLRLELALGTGDRELTSSAFDDLKRANSCLLYTSPSPRDQRGSRMPSSA